MSKAAGIGEADPKRLRRLRAVLALFAACTLLGAFGGCSRSWLNGFLDPTQVGRFDSAARRREIRRTLSVLVDEPEGIAGATEPTSEDLSVAFAETPLGPGDAVEVSIFELLAADQEFRLTRIVNEVGYISLPELGLLKVTDKTPRQLEVEIADKLRSDGLILSPQVAVTVIQSQSKRFTIIGASPRPGTYAIPRPDYRLLDAIGDAGGVPAEIRTIYVIRQGARKIELAPGAEDLYKPPEPPPIGELEAPARGPAVVEDQGPLVSPRIREDEVGADLARQLPLQPEPMDRERLVPEMAEEPGAPPTPEPQKPEAAAPEDESSPTIESLLPPPGGGEGPRPAAEEPPATTEPIAPDEMGEVLEPEKAAAPWVYDAVRGEWVPVPQAERGREEEFVTPTKPAAPAARPTEEMETPPVEEGAAPRPPTESAEPAERPAPAKPVRRPGEVDWEALAEPEVPTRVIAVAVKPLLQGDPRYNIVVRPNDVINVEMGQVGEFYIMGNVLRPGAYNLTGREITVREAIAAAGGFGPLALPSRAELIRRGVGDEEEVRMIDLDAVFAGEADNFFLKAHDIINVGTNPLMPFIATIRNAFRVSYGFGFVYDRNFADIDSFFGQQNPTDRRRNERLLRGFPP